MSETTLSSGDWFATDVQYGGEAVAVFADPPIQVRGTAHVQFRPDGKPHPIKLVVEQAFGPTDYEPEFGASELFYGRKPGTRSFSMGSFRTRNPCLSLEITGPDGTFRAATPISYEAPFKIPSDSFDSLTFHTSGGTLVARPEASAFWVLYLTNLDTEYGPACSENLLEHPLRVQRSAPIPEGLEGDELVVAKLNALTSCPAIQFEFLGKTCFLEASPDSDEVRERLSALQEQTGVTSVAVGAFPDPVESPDEALRLVPYEIVALLNLATGRRCGYRWIELRSSYGSLVARSHTWLPSAAGLGNRIGALRHPTSNLGWFLTEGLSSPVIKDGWFRGTLLNMLRCAEARTYEERLTWLFLAVETAAEHFGTRVENLGDRLSTRSRGAVLDVIGAAVRALEPIRQSAPDTDAKTIAWIQNRLLSSSTRPQKFGSSFRDLLNEAGLPYDLPIAENAYQKRRRPEWPREFIQALALWRNHLLHGGQFGGAVGFEDPDYLWAVHMHLYDCLVRILLKSLSYTGVYDPPVLLTAAGLPLDWVTAESSPERLGYGREHYRG